VDAFWYAMEANTIGIGILPQVAPSPLCVLVMASVRRMTGKARTTSICSKAVDCPLGKAYGDLTGYPAKLEHESGAG